MKDRKTLLNLYTNQTSRFVNVNGSLMHYRDEGEGDVILLIHGACASLHTFEPWAERLKENYRVVSIDLPGSGLSEAPEWDENDANGTYIKYVRAFLEILQIESCCIVGNSLGGWIAWEMASRYPKLINRLVLLSAAGHIDHTSVPSIFYLGRIPMLNKMGRAVIARSFIQKNMEAVFVHSNLVTTKLVDRYYDLFSQKANTSAFLFWLGSKFVDNTKKLSKIKQPTLIIWGEQDSWIKINNAYRFSNAIPNSELVIYEDLGHIPQEEAPEKTVEDVIEFMEKYPLQEGLLKVA